MSHEVTDPILTAEDLGIYEVKPLSNMWVKKSRSNGTWMLTPDGFKKVNNYRQEVV